MEIKVQASKWNDILSLDSKCALLRFSLNKLNVQTTSRSEIAARKTNLNQAKKED